MSKKDNVSNPKHYNSGTLGIEVIDIIENSLNKDGFEGFLVGNIIKYVCRFKLKNGKEDLKKAEWYLKKVIEMYEKIDDNNSVLKEI